MAPEPGYRSSWYRDMLTITFSVVLLFSLTLCTVSCSSRTRKQKDLKGFVNDSIMYEAYLVDEASTGSTLENPAELPPPSQSTRNFRNRREIIFFDSAPSPRNLKRKQSDLAGFISERILYDTESDEDMELTEDHPNSATSSPPYDLVFNSDTSMRPVTEVPEEIDLEALASADLRCAKTLNKVT